MATLEVIGGPNAGRQFLIDRGRSRIGRHPNCDVLLDWVAAVSRYHAEVSRRDNRFFIEDSNSRNGTFVNGERVRSSQRLYDHDRVRICDLEFVFHDDRPESRAPESSMVGKTMSFQLLDDEDTAQSEIMSRLDVSSVNHRLHVRASANAKLHAMMELSESLGQALSVDDVLGPVLDTLFKVFLHADHGVIALIGEDGDWEPRCMRFRRPDQRSVQISRSIIDHVIQSREAVLSAHTPNDTRFDASESIVSLEINSFICAPLIDTEGRVLGAMQIDATGKSERFQDEDLELAVSVASQAAIAINRAMLHDSAIQVREVQAEMDLARRVQLGLLPETKPEIDGYEFFDFYRAANKIGGDYYDYVSLPDGRLVAIVADVSGHGIAAAMVMAKLAAEFRFTLATIDDPGKVVGRLNDLLCSDNVDDRFVTMVLMLLNPTTHEIEVVNAGHPSPLWRKPDGTVECLRQNNGGPLLGVIEGAEYGVAVHSLEPGDTIAIYTDGITEAARADGEQYGEVRMLEQFGQPAENLTAIGKGVIDGVMGFAGDNAQGDDICLVCVSRDCESDRKAPA